MRFFSVESQVNRLISFITKAVDRLNSLHEKAQRDIAEAQAAIAIRQANITACKFQQDRITRIKNKLEGLVS